MITHIFDDVKNMEKCLSLFKVLNEYESVASVDIQTIFSNIKIKIAVIYCAINKGKIKGIWVDIMFLEENIKALQEQCKKQIKRKNPPS